MALTFREQAVVGATVASPPAQANDPRNRVTAGDDSRDRGQSMPYRDLRALLLRYLSPILVDTVLNQAMFKRRLAAHTLTAVELRELAPDMMLGLRLFVDEKRLPELMVSLAELIEQGEP